jgi:uncharacterized protein involved in outer membrane biogenesis
MRNIIRAHRAQALIASLLTFSAGSALAEEKVFDRTFTATPGGLLTVDADGADISVKGSDGNQVIVHMVARASQKQLDGLSLSATQSQDGVTVEMRRLDHGLFNLGSWEREGLIEVTVPRNYRVEAKTSGGDMRLESTIGAARVRTSGGDITVLSLKGDLKGQTSGGEVRLDSVEGSMQVKTSGGNIRAAGVRGDIDASTSGGDVRLTGIDGRILASTSGGSVKCELVGANRGISTSTSGGNIELTMPKNTRGSVDAESNGGDITSDFSVETSRWAEHRLNGQINGGGDTIRVRASGGSIKLIAGNQAGS